MIFNTDSLIHWLEIEFVLSAILFVIYHSVVKRLKNPIDRFSFLRLSFLTILFVPFLSDLLPDLHLFTNSTSEQTRLTFSELTLKRDGFIRDISTGDIQHWIMFFYFSILLIRLGGVFNSIIKFHKISRSGYSIQTGSSYPITVHNYDIPPVTIGIINPKILLSEKIYKSLSPKELKMVISHEEEHIRRLDTLFILLRFVVREILFFSPFIWNLSRKFEEEMELSVDATVLSTQQFHAKEYGKLLVGVADHAYSTSFVNSPGLYLSNNFLKRRIVSMKTPLSKRSRLMNQVAFTLFLVAGVTGVSAFGVNAYSNSSGIEFFIQKDSNQNSVPSGKPSLDSRDFASASFEKEQCQPDCTISLTLKPSAQKRFSKLSEQNIGKHMSIVVDKKVISSPTIQSKIDGPGLQITVAGDSAKEVSQKIVDGINTESKTQ